MGWRFRRSIGIGPLRWNLSKSGVGYSVGVPGIRVSTSPNGRRYLWLSLPGTGLAWSKEIGRVSSVPSKKRIQRVPSGTKVKQAIREIQSVATENVRPTIDLTDLRN
jgi:hypothetical protein